MSLTPIVHGASPINAATPSGRLRGVAGAVAHGFATPPVLALPAGVRLITGRVTSAGTWHDANVSAALQHLLGTELAPALRPSFEWYLCRGAFFHNDAHFDDVLFGVWCVAGPAAEVFFPRAGVRCEASPGHAVLFDPFEVHGVLAPGRRHYAVDDYADAAPSVFVGFELQLDAAVAAAFHVGQPADARTLSSGTRISAVTGAFE